MFHHSSEDENNTTLDEEVLDTEKRGGNTVNKKAEKENRINLEEEVLDTEKRGGNTVDVTIAHDDEKRNKAHKECVQNKRKKGNIKEMDTGNVTLANDDVKQNKARKEKEIVPPEKEPNDIQKRRMLGHTMQIMILAGMENHIYRFDNEIKKQTEGGPIDLFLTGEIADCYLIQWDKKNYKS